MKKILKELEKIKERLEEAVDQRETTFYDRSEKWQESENGEIHQDKTGELESVSSDIEMAIDNLESFLE